MSAFFVPIVCRTEALAEPCPQRVTSPHPGPLRTNGENWLIADHVNMAHRGTRLGKRFGSARQSYTESPCPLRTCFGRSGASPPYGVVKLPNVF